MKNACRMAKREIRLSIQQVEALLRVSEDQLARKAAPTGVFKPILSNIETVDRIYLEPGELIIWVS